MFTLSLYACLLGVGPADKVPPSVELFAKEGWYKEQPGKEQDFIGVLKKAERKGGVGFGRSNPYRLEMEKDTREVYVGGKPDILNAYVGRRVKITGKPVDLEVEGSKHREIWPARLEVLAAGDKEKKGKERPVTARAFWPYVSADPDRREKAMQLVIRSAEELTRRRPWSDLDAPPPVVEKMATDAVSKLLKVKTIDWKEEMLLVVTGGTQSSGGFRIGIERIREEEGKLIVDWFLTPPTGFATDAFTHPAEVVLTTRFEGPVEFNSVGGAKVRPGIERRDSFDEARAGDVKKEDAPGLKVHAESKANLGLRGHQVIRSAEELAKVRGAKDADKAAQDLAKQLKVEGIDWKKQMVLMIAGGTQRSGGFSVELMSLTTKEKELHVRWKLNTPAPGRPVTLALTNPSLTLLVDRFEGEVRFDPPAPKSKLDR